MKKLLSISSGLAFCMLSGNAAERKPQVVETPGARITVGTHRVGKYASGCTPSFCVIYMKIENTSDQEITLDFGKWFMKTEEGKALPAMLPSEAEKMMIGKTAWTTAAIVGPRLSPTAQQDMGTRLQETMVAPGTLPAKSFVEGKVFYRGSGDKKKRPSELHLEGLGPGAIPLSW
jgi:hypothetical protein